VNHAAGRAAINVELRRTSREHGTAAETPRKFQTLEQSPLRTGFARPYGRITVGIGNWSLTSLQQRLVKTGGRLVKHARSYWLLLAEGHLTRRLFGSMVRRINALPVPAG
jgi:hypothetical protein